MYASEMTPADIAACTGGNNNGNGGFFGGDWMGLIVLFLLFGMFGFGGFGMGGFGGFGGGFGGLNGGGFLGAELQRGFENQNVIRKLDEQTYGLADATYALNNTITNGFHGVDNAICNLGYNVQSGINGISREIGDCCCQTQRAIDGVNYNMAKGFCDISNVIQNTTRDVIDNQNANSRAILDFLTQDKIATLTAENQSLKFQASQTAQNAFITANQQAQTAELIRRLGADCPTPAYVVQPPTPVTFPANCCGQVQFANQGCGCGSY